MSKMGSARSKFDELSVTGHRQGIASQSGFGTKMAVIPLFVNGSKTANYRYISPDTTVLKLREQSFSLSGDYSVKV